MRSFRSELEEGIVQKDIVHLRDSIEAFNDEKFDGEKFRSYRLARGIYGQRQEQSNVSTKNKTSLVHVTSFTQPLAPELPHKVDPSITPNNTQKNNQTSARPATRRPRSSSPILREIGAPTRK